MEDFFSKHAKHFGDKEAVKLIKEKAQEAYDDAKEYPKESHFVKHLAELWEMLEDYFECKNIDPETILQ